MNIMSENAPAPSLRRGSLAPLPAEIRRGLVAAAVLGCLSLASTTVLFLYIACRRLQRRAASRRPEHDAPDLSLGLAQRQLVPAGGRGQGGAAAAAARRPLPGGPESESESSSSSPFLLLIQNLLAADVALSMSFSINIAWLLRDGIFEGEAGCWAQGLFLSVGRTGAGVLLLGIALNTYLILIWGYRPSQSMVVAVMVVSWVLIDVLVIAGPLATNNGRDEGGWFVQAYGGCWVNPAYTDLQFWLGDFEIFLSFGLSVVLYAWVFVSLRRNKQSAWHLPRQKGEDENAPPRPSGHHPAFLVYPVIYFVCASPFMFGGIMVKLGHEISSTYVCYAGGLFAATGLMDAMLWSTTIMFSSPQEIKDTGLEMFDFMRTPHGRRYGNMVWVQGAARSRRAAAAAGGAAGPDEERGIFHRTWWRMGGGPGQGSSSVGWPWRNTSQESLQSHDGDTAVNGNAIRMDIITTVTVDNINNGKGGTLTTESTDSLKKGNT